MLHPHIHTHTCIHTHTHTQVGRTKLVRDVLERLMEDDADMLRMCLSQQVKQQQQQMMQRRSSMDTSMVQGASGLFNTSSSTPTPPLAVPTMGGTTPPQQRGVNGWSASGVGASPTGRDPVPLSALGRHPSLLAVGLSRRHGVPVNSEGIGKCDYAA